jgi:hypothetical protein
MSASSSVEIERLDRKREDLATAIRDDGWLNVALWWRLVSTIRRPEDFPLIEILWRDAPGNAHRRNPVCRAFARAAAVTGHHTICRRTLLAAVEQLQLSRQPPRVPLIQRVRRRLSSKASPTRPVKVADVPFAERAATALSDLKASCDDVNMDIFLVSGTLLGCVREGNILGWDKDVDVGAIKSDMPDKIEEHLASHPRFRLATVDLISDRIRLNHDSGVKIDLFPHYREGERVWHDGAATRWWNSPFELESAHFLGNLYFVPSPPECYLEENYGDWTTPEGRFDARIDAPNVEITDKEHFISLLYFSLENAVRTQQPAAIRRYRELIREYDEA